MSITQRLAEFIHQPGPGLRSAAVRQRAARCMLDTLAVTVAGYREAPVQALKRALPLDASQGSAPVPWGTARYREDDACVMVGTAAHALDYDDVSMQAICHPSAPVLAALWVLLEQTQASGEQLLDAYAVGTEVLIRSGQAMGFRHYDLGFHATATLGTLGAAAACSHLLGLEPARISHALAIAASMSAGIRKNFGSMVKPLHVGLAAANGLRAVRYAAAGLQGSAEPLEDHGWLRVFSGAECNAWPQSLGLGQPFAIEAPGFEQKRYPCCYMMHKIVSATLSLRQRYGLSLNGLSSARVEMGGGASAPLIYSHPVTGLQAKFSGPYAVVGTLHDGCMNLSSFDDKSVLRPAVQSALSIVTVEEKAALPVRGDDVGKAAVTVTLDYESGRRYVEAVSVMPGSREDPLTDEDLLEKWRDCLGWSLEELKAMEVDELFRDGLEMYRQPSAHLWMERLHPRS